jgi:hypothetical protein
VGSFPKYLDISKSLPKVVLAECIRYMKSYGFPDSRTSVVEIRWGMQFAGESMLLLDVHIGGPGLSQNVFLIHSRSEQKVLGRFRFGGHTQ